jgi:preprotein translocase subunit SecE
VAKSAVDKKAEKKTGGNRLFRYFRETYYELRRVSWPSRSEAINLTIIVVVVTMALSIILGLVDWAFSAAFGGFFNLFGV